MQENHLLTPFNSRLVACAAIVAAALASTCHATAQTADSFNPNPDNAVYAVAQQGDGRILCGGSFTLIGSSPHAGLSRLNGDGTDDPSFNASADGLVLVMTLQTDGKILVGGTITNLDGQPRIGLGRLNPDGTLDTGFTADVSSDYPIVRAIEVQRDGKIIVGGSFTNIGGQNRMNIARLNPDGSVDSSFNPSADSDVSAVALQSDGKILVGGSFSALAGQPCTLIGRLNTNGTRDASFTASPDSTVFGICLQPDGGMLLLGYFYYFGGGYHINVARLNANGTADNTFNPWPIGGVNSIGLQTDGKMILGGDFHSIGGQNRQNIARVAADGTLDGFNPGADGSVEALGLQADGRALVSGYFATLCGQPRVYAGRLSNSPAVSQSLSFAGSTLTWTRTGAGPEISAAYFDLSTNGLDWTALGSPSRVPGGWQLTGLILPANASIRASGCVSGGYFNRSRWFVQKFFGKPVILAQPAAAGTNDAGTSTSISVLADGSAPLAFTWRKSGSLTTLSTNSTLTLSNVLGADSGTYYVIVSNANGSVTSSFSSLVVRDPLLLSQLSDQKLAPGDTAAFTASVTGTTPVTYQWFKNGSLLPNASASTLVLTNLQSWDAASYYFTASNVVGVVTSAPAALTLGLDVADTFNPGANLDIFGFVVRPDSNIVAVGAFSMLDGVTRTNLAFLTPSGHADPSRLIGANDQISCVLGQPDGKLIIGGSFSVVAGQGRIKLARLDTAGVLDPLFNPAVTGTYAEDVWCLALQPDGKILVGGTFTAIGGIPCTNIARLNTNGSVDTNFVASPNSEVDSIAVQPDGRILIGGWFSTVSGQDRHLVARLLSNGAVDSIFQPGASRFPLGGVPPHVGVVALQPDGKVLVAGDFDSMGGLARLNLARLNPDGSADPQFDPSPNYQLLSLALQANGKILAGGSFTSLGAIARAHIARLNPDGSVDDYNPGASGGYYVRALMLQPDGKVLLGGDFTTAGSQSRTDIARLRNSESASQALYYDGTQLLWTRGGSSPEATWTTLEVSSNGVSWQAMPAPVRFGGGWSSPIATLPSNAVVRARAMVNGGYNYGSSYCAEWRAVPVPAILADSMRVANNSGQVTFTVGGVPGQTITVERSSNLATWIPGNTFTFVLSSMTITNAYPSGDGPFFFRTKLQ